MTSERAVEARTWNETRNGYDVTGPCYACGSPIAYFVDEDGTPRDIRAAPREDGWEELRREIEALPEANDGTAGEWSLVERRAVLTIADRLAAARGEPPEPGLREALRDANAIIAMTREHLAKDHPDCAYTALGVMNDASRAALVPDTEPVP